MSGMLTSLNVTINGGTNSAHQAGRGRGKGALIALSLLLAVTLVAPALAEAGTKIATVNHNDTVSGGNQYNVPGF